MSKPVMPWTLRRSAHASWGMTRRSQSARTGHEPVQEGSRAFCSDCLWCRMTWLTCMDARLWCRMTWLTCMDATRWEKRTKTPMRREWGAITRSAWKERREEELKAKTYYFLRVHSS